MISSNSVDAVLKIEAVDEMATLVNPKGGIIAFGTNGDPAFVVVEVAEQKSLTFLKTVAGPTLFVRFGSHRLPVESHELEKYFALQRH